MASKYDRIAGDLRTQIQAGTMTGQLPPETELAGRYRVALNTLRRALDVLESEGLVSSQQGTGTFVRPVRQRVRRDHADRYQWEKDRVRLSEEDRRGTGATEKDTGLNMADLDFAAEYATIGASDDIAVRFAVAPGTELLKRIYWTRAKSETAPLSLVTSYLVKDTISANPDLLDATKEPWPGGTQSQLHTVGIEVDQIRDEITARPPYADESQKLDLEPGIAVIVLWKTSVDITGRVVELSEVILPGDRTQIEYTTKLARWK